MSCIFDISHDPFCQRCSLCRIVRNAQHQQCICPAHDTQTDLSGSTGDFCDLIQRVVVHIDDIVQEVHGRFHGFSQQPEVKFIADQCLSEHFHQIDGAQIAAFIRQQRLLTARVGAFDLAHGRDHVIPVQTIQEDDARLSVFPGMVHDHIEDLLRTEMADGLLGLRIDQVVIAVALYRLHKGLSNAHADIEIGDFLIVCLAVDEIQNVRMINPQNPHICASSGASLLHGLRGRIEHFHKTDGAACHTAGAPYC